MKILPSVIFYDMQSEETFYRMKSDVTVHGLQSDVTFPGVKFTTGRDRMQSALIFDGIDCYGSLWSCLF